LFFAKYSWNLRGGGYISGESLLRRGQRLENCSVFSDGFCTSPYNQDPHKTMPVPIPPSEDEVRRILGKQKELPDPEKIDEMADQATRRLGGIKIFADIIDDFLTLIRLVRAYTFRGYREVPLGSILAAVGAIVYFVNPVDIIPDFIPVIGYIDDVAVVGFALKFIRDDLEAFRIWEEQQDGGDS